MAFLSSGRPRPAFSDERGQFTAALLSYRSFASGSVTGATERHQIGKTLMPLPPR